MDNKVYIVIGIIAPLIVLFGVYIVYLLSEIERKIDSIDSKTDRSVSRMESHDARIDTLYKMFVDLLKGV